MPLLNPSFEDAGALAGEAKHWTILTVTSLEAIAGFGTNPENAWEDFERWFVHVASFDDVPTVHAGFDPEGRESFSKGWRNDIYFFALPSARLVTASFEGHPVESLETGWNNETYAWTWESVAARAGLFDGQSHEDFERGWRNEPYARSWESVTARPALFDSTARPVEDFSGPWSRTTQGV